LSAKPKMDFSPGPFGALHYIFDDVRERS